MNPHSAILPENPEQLSFDATLLDKVMSQGIYWELGQFWQQETDPRFLPGCVRMARHRNGLFILADLKDESVNETAFPFNYAAFREADAFEIFIKDLNASYYHEFHVTPSNSRLQLRFDVDKPHLSLDHHFVWTPLFSSCTRIVQGGWQVLVSLIPESLGLSNDSHLQISFGRYDYTHGHAIPVISSTSKHTVADFHRLEEWTTV